jgi:rubrerythrin
MRRLQSIRDILDYAIEQEADANRLYNHLAQEVKKVELRTALENFAIDEYRHKLRLEGVRDGDVELTSEQIGTLNYAETLKEVKLRPEMSYPELLAYAIKKEAEAERLYTKLAQLNTQEHIKELFTLLAQEEARHKLNLEIEYDLTTF